MELEFNNYCLLILGNIGDSGEVLKQITEEEIKYIEGKGLFMATFLSVLSPNELKNCFADKKCSVIVFKLNEDVSSVELNNKEKHNHLFEDFEKTFEKKQKLNKNFGSMIVLDKELIEEDNLNNIKEEIKNMDKEQRKSLMDNIFDKGINNLTSGDKKILEILASRD